MLWLVCFTSSWSSHHGLLLGDPYVPFSLATGSDLRENIESGPGRRSGCCRHQTWPALPDDADDFLRYQSRGPSLRCSSVDQVARAHLTWPPPIKTKLMTEMGKKRIKTSMGGIHHLTTLWQMGWIDRGFIAIIIRNLVKCSSNLVYCAVEKCMPKNTNTAPCKGALRASAEIKENFSKPLLLPNSSYSASNAKCPSRYKIQSNIVYS